MLLSESIYFLILFTLPAALKIIFNTKIRYVPIVQQDKSIELAECVVFCMVVFFLNLLFMEAEIIKFGEYMLLSEEERILYAKKTGFDYLTFMVQYFVLNLMTSAGFIVVWYSAGQWIFRKIKNWTNRASHRDEIAKYPDVWRNLFETNKFIDVSKCIVKIERSGQLVTAGLLRLYPSPIAEKRELALYNTDSIRELFEDDKGKTTEDRLFLYAEVEYYDMETDTLIKFYNMDKYNAYYETEEPE